MVQMGLAASRELWKAGSVPSLAQWIKDPVLPQLQHRSQLWLRSDPWSPKLHMPQGSQKRKKKIEWCNSMFSSQRSSNKVGQVNGHIINKVEHQNAQTVEKQRNMKEGVKNQEGPSG